ncbi:MAG: hypothetical protein LC753_12475 [Acidobacteria bacterium]|nr:hypothetical protein [Acidobacteriota bacterium]MCA1651052.1 hypothetical protein [Acidobacteriota bacterium]
MDRVAQRLADYTWPYADQDPAALSEIAKRVARVGSIEGLVTYTELVSGIDFRLPTVNAGQPLRLGVPEWTDLHRAVIGDFLGRLCVDTYTLGQFMGSALVVASDTRQPSEGYREFMRQLGLLRGRRDAEFLAHWIPETRKAYDWYARPTNRSR